MVSPTAMASQGGEQPVLSGRLAALLFLAPGDLFSLRENLASSTASVLFPGSWPFPKWQNVG